MPRDRATPLPAAIPSLAFALSLWIAPSLVLPVAVIAGELTILAMVLKLRAGNVRARAAGIVICALAGTLVGVHDHARDRRGLQLAGELNPQRFETVQIVATKPWARTVDGRHLLLADEFTLLRNGNPVVVAEQIAIYLTGKAPTLGHTRGLVAEGFLSRTDRRWYLRVKSDALVRLEGTIRGADPRFWNRMISEALEKVTSPEIEEPVALARALALGQSDRLPTALRSSYLDGGTYHLLVFSGLQIGFAAAAVAWLLRGFRRPLLVDLSLLLIAGLAPVFAGNEPSVTRSSLMIGLWALARIAARPTARANLLFVAAMVRLCMAPHELTDAGFALTFAATSGLAITGPALGRALRVTSSSGRSALSGLAAEAGVLPFTIFFFNRYVIGGWLITMIISPLIVLMLAVSFLICFAALLAPQLVAPLANLLAHGDGICRAANRIADEVLGLGGVAIPMSAALLIAAVVAAVVMASSQRIVLRGLTVVILALPTTTAILATARTPLVAGPSLTMIDVGQGDATLLSDGEHAILVDGGGARNDPRFGDRVLVPALLRLGARRLDAVVISHPHPDHCGGIASAVLRLETKEVWMSGRHLREACSQDIFDAARRRRVPVVILEKNPRTRVGRIRVRPILHRLRYKASPLNNGSVVLFARSGEMTALLTGDVEREAEFVLADDGLIPKARVLKVPHHGSRTSTTDFLLDAVEPEIALISCGLDNQYGHPAGEVLDRLRRRRSRIIRSDRSGTTTVHFSGGRSSVNRSFD